VESAIISARFQLKRFNLALTSPEGVSFTEEVSLFFLYFFFYRLIKEKALFE